MKSVLSFFAAIFLTASAAAGPLRDAVDSAGDAAKYVGESVADTAGAMGKSVKNTAQTVTGSKTAAEARREIDAAAAQGLRRLLAESAAGRALYEKSYGYAVFDTRKYSFLITTGTGAGVVVEKSTGERTYMKMATGGANLGMGVQFFQVVFLFEDKASLNKFVKQGWEANAAASAVLGRNALEHNARFVEGMAVFQFVKTGLMAGANLTGTKYWRSDDLNSK